MPVVIAILVGKDGGVKLRQNAQVKLNDIFALIDAMPMRQEEMRQKPNLLWLVNIFIWSIDLKTIPVAIHPDSTTKA